MKRSYVKYLSALLLFGSNGIVASHISLTSYEIVFLRTLIGSLLLIVLYKFTGGKFSFTKYPQQFLLLIGSGIAMGASWMFLYEAYRQIGVSIASLAYYCGPVIVMILSPLLFKEKLTLPKIIGFIVVVCGIFLTNNQAMQEGKSTWGLFFGAMSAVLYAIMLILNKKANKIIGLENSMLQLTFSFVSVAVFIGMKQGFIISIGRNDWIPVLILGLINTGIGCYLYFSSLSALKVQTVAVCGYLEPLSAVFLSALFLKETLQPIQVVGAVLIIGGAMFGECVTSNISKKESNFT
jgi:drug/metabolite transporter (DMT)-like permease